jgi:hypothetical protein
LCPLRYLMSDCIKIHIWELKFDQSGAIWFYGNEWKI